MKKLVSIVSFILCAAMLTMSFSAATVTGDAQAVLTKSIDKMRSANFMEIKAVHRETTTYDGNSETELQAGRFKLIMTSDGKLMSELLTWNENSEILSLAYIKDGYLYDSLTREKYTDYDSNTIKDLISELTGLYPDYKKQDLKNLTMQKTQDGYELRYKITPNASSQSTSYVIVIGKDYAIKSIRISRRIPSESFDTKITEKYEFVSINEPFTINFPSDLNSYTPA